MGIDQSGLQVQEWVYGEPNQTYGSTNQRKTYIWNTKQELQDPFWTSNVDHSWNGEKTLGYALVYLLCSIDVFIIVV
jgi:hypothetical protein